MSNYYEIFQQRCYNRGLLLKERVQQQVGHNFQRFLKSSPNAVEIKVNNEGNSIRVAVLSDKDNDTLFKRFFLCDKSDGIKVGDFLYWDDTIWLVFKKELDTIQAYDKFECYQCRHSVKWIDNGGILRETPCYLVAQTDEKIKANFRTWNNMITPQPNKFMEIITSRTNIELGQKFLVDETAWFVVESDYISVKDILYLSLTEDKKDLYVDDIENNIANIIDLNKFVIQLQSNNITLGIDEEYYLNAQIYLNGLLYSDEFLLEVIEGQDCVEVIHENNSIKIKAVNPGKAKAHVYMSEHPDVFETLEITIEEIAQEPIITYELRGDASIKWGRTKIYQCVKITNGIEESIPCVFTVEDNNNLLEEFDINNSTITLTANEDNNVGSVKLIAEFEDKHLEKEIKITSLWM